MKTAPAAFLTTFLCFSIPAFSEDSKESDENTKFAQTYARIRAVEPNREEPATVKAVRALDRMIEETGNASKTAERAKAVVKETNKLQVTPEAKLVAIRKTEEILRDELKHLWDEGSEVDRRVFDAIIDLEAWLSGMKINIEKEENQATKADYAILRDAIAGHLTSIRARRETLTWNRDRLRRASLEIRPHLAAVDTFTESLAFADSEGRKKIEERLSGFETRIDELVEILREEPPPKKDPQAKK